MSREIKFRAWDKKQSKWHEDWRSLFPWGTQMDDRRTLSVGIMPAYFEFVQYTGLKDKNGVEIYEGDILDDGGVIEFRTDLNWDSGGSPHSGFFSIQGYEYRDDGCLSYHYVIEQHEVIGNIYENPDLLRG